MATIWSKSQLRHLFVVDKRTGTTTPFLDVSDGKKRKGDTIGLEPSTGLLYHLDGQNMAEPGTPKDLLFESINLTTKTRTAITDAGAAKQIIGPEFFVIQALTAMSGSPPTGGTDGDINGDGKADLVWRNTSDGSTAIWLMNGTTRAAAGFLTGQPLAWSIVQVGDVTGDGKADLIWRNSSTGGVEVWVMEGTTVTTTGFPGTVPTVWDIQ